MSCLLNDKQRESLRVKIASDFLTAMNSDAPFDIDLYIRDMYNKVKSKTNNEALAFDVARLIPTLSAPILATDTDVKNKMRAKGLTLGKLDDLEVSFENIDYLNEFLGLKEIPTALIKSAQQTVNTTPEKPVEEKDFQEESINFSDGVIRTFVPFNVKPGSKDEIALDVQKVITDELNSQIANRGINDSSEMTYPGVATGIYGRIVADMEGYKGLSIILSDKAGIPIKFTNDGKVSPNGKIMIYPLVASPLTDEKGNIITDKKKFDEVVKEKNVTGVPFQKALSMFNAIQKQITDGIAKRNPEGKTLTKEESAEARESVINDLNNQYKGYQQMRDYLNKSSDNFVLSVMDGASEGFLFTNSFKVTSLRRVNFEKGFQPYLETTEKGVKPGTVYFRYPGVNQPILALGNEISTNPEIANAIISLFSEDLFVNGERMPIEERVSLLDQYIFTAGIKFLSNEIGGKGRNWTDSKGRYTVEVDSKSYSIKFDGSEEASKLQEALAAAISDYFNKPFLKEVSKEIAEKSKAKQVTDLKAASPKTIYVENSKYYRVQFPVIHADKNLINKKYKDLSFTKSNGRTNVSYEEKPYNDFILDNFSTTAFVTEDGKIRQENTFATYSPVVTELSKFIVKPEKTKSIHDDYKGKVIFLTPGSGKTDLAKANVNVVDADDLTIDAIMEIQPSFPLDKSIPSSRNIYNAIAYAGIDKNALYELVKKKIGESVSEGKTVVTGSSNLMDVVDYVFTQKHPDILKNRADYNTQKEISAAKSAGKEPIAVYKYAENILNTPVSKVKTEKAPVIQEKESVKPTDDPATQKGPADQTPDDILKAIANKNRFLEKSGFQKAISSKATETQAKRALEWYSSSPLSKHFPFKTVFAAVNINNGGPAAQWAVQGITLFHYYNEDGKIDKSKSGDFTELYHEAWHGFTQTFLTKEQRTALYEETRKLKGTFVDFKGNTVSFKNATAWQLEEYLAEDFRKFMMGGGKVSGKSVKISLFTRILNFLKELFGKAKVQDVAANPMDLPMIAELYQKMSLGELSNYNFDVSNRDKTIGVLEHAMISRDENASTKELSFEDSSLLVNTVDSIISTIINDMINKYQNRSFTTQLMKDPEDAAGIYTVVKEKLQQKRTEFNTLIEKETNDFQKEQLKENAKLIDWALDNFGDLNNLSNNSDGKGLIYYHTLKSRFISDEERDMLFDDIDEVGQLIKASDLYSQSGNEKSIKNLASADIHQLLKSIHKYDDKGQPALNRLGFQELTEQYNVWNKIARTLSGTMTRQAMYDTLNKAAFKNGRIKDPVIYELLNKLGAPQTKTRAETELWINFWKTFNLAEIPLVQMTLKTEEDNSYRMTIGSAHRQVYKVGNIWKNSFRTVNTKYIKRDPDKNFNNYLDLVKIVDDFADLSTGFGPESRRLKKDKEFDFLNAIGIRLSDKEEIREALSKGVGSPSVIFNKIKRLINERGITKVYSLDELFNEYREDGKLQAIPSDNARFNELKELETQYADYVANDMVTNAEGNVQFERSLHNSISIMVSTINDAKTYADLIALPYMKHLDINKSPFAGASVWLNSIFDIDAYKVDGVGAKRKKGTSESAEEVKLIMNNLSGVQLIDQEGDQGIASAKADEFTKLILDFHLTTAAGRPELMRHADKSTSFSVSLSDITGGSKDGKFYVDTVSLIENQEGVVSGYTSAVKILTPYINAELKRIKQLEELAKSDNLVYDAFYLKEGQKFVIFEDVLSDTIKDTLLKYNTLDEALAANPNLSADITNTVSSYFENQFNEVSELLNKPGKEFIDAGLVDSTTIKANLSMKSTKAISKKETKKGLVRSFVVNSWIHNLESMSIIYGDVALYNMKKEEFHKRNAGAGSTGNLFASDVDILNYVNNKGRLYARSIGAQEKTLAMDGSFDTAVLADNEIPSKSYSTINENIKKDLVKKGITEKEASDLADKMTKAYKEGMNEGDAQGWITFDFYRALSILEGKWSIEQDELYKAIIENKPVDPTKITEFFPTRKFQYWGPVETEADQLPLMAFHKFSLFPMIPSVIKGTNLEQLHNKMINQGVDYALFKSGSKISTVTKIADNGSAIQDKFYKTPESHEFEEAGEFTKNRVFLNFLKDQLEVAPYFKEKVTFPTQMRKLIENGLMENGVPVDFKKGKNAWVKLSESEKIAASPLYRKIADYENTISKLTELRKKELIEQAGIEFKDGKVLLTDKLRKFLVNEMTNQDLGEHEIAFINKKGTPDLSISLSAEKLEKILNSIVVRRLVKQKFNGEGLIQVSGAGFEKTLKGEVAGTNELPFYERNPDGSTAAMKVKIALQGDFVNLLYLKHKDGKTIETLERLNEMIKDEKWLDLDNHRQMISIIGPRIPVQGLNSMEFAEVYEFLPREAGSIVVLPSEIVAKSGSDFDIDKLTFMMPNISDGIDYEYWKTKEGLAKLKALDDTTTLNLSAENVERVIANKKSPGKTIEDRAILRMLADNSVKRVTYPMNNTTAEGLENKILNQMRDFLSLQDNYIALIRPNDTNIVKPLADELSSEVMDKDYRTIQDGKVKRISGTRVFEVGYNLYKHSSNNIGKQTLGMGAVDNTYNALFNRIGAHMNYEYDNAGTTKRLTILLPHNTLTDEQGRKVISLSHLKDVEGTDISDVISQLINGWVDIAKDAWIFNLQGNKEITPTLTFMIQAGVPVDQAVYLVSNPMVRAYVKEQKLAKSTFAKPLDKSPGNPLFFRHKARQVILGDPAYGINMTPEVLKGKKAVFQEKLNTLTLQFTSESGLFDPKNVKKNLRERITAFAKEGKNFKYTDYDRAAFLHFLELEEMAKSMTAIKTKTNVDTSRSNTLFDAQYRLEMIEELKNDGKFPAWMVDKLIGNPEKGIVGESPIASFNIQAFQISLWQDLFKLRNNSTLNKFILDKMSTPGFMDIVESTWGTTEKFNNAFRNDLVPFVFQNYLRQFDLEGMTEYKGIASNTSYNVKSLPSLAHGVFVKNVGGEPVIYLDKLKLKSDYVLLSQKKADRKQTITLEDGRIIQLATVPAAAFPTADTYYSFVFERELLRNTYLGKEGWAILQERKDVQDKLREYAITMEDKSSAEIATLVYEETIRDMALDNTYNTWKLFKSRDSMADQLTSLQASYPELITNYSVVNNLSASVTGNINGVTRVANIVLNDMMLDSDKINSFNQNLRELSDPAAIRINTTSAVERARVAEFFNKLSIYAFLQSGLNSTGMFSLVRIVPQERFTELMTAFEGKFLPNINNLTLERYWNKFLTVNGSSQRRLRSRFRDYTISNFNPESDSKVKPELAKAKAKEDVQVAKRLFTDNAGNIVYYANPGYNQDGLPVTGLTMSEARTLAADNSDTAFVMNGPTESTSGANKNESALLEAKATTGNIIPFPVRRRFGISSDAKFTDVTAEQAAQNKTEELKTFKDSYKYYGSYYTIDVKNGVGVDVEGYKGKAAAKAKLLANYNANPDVDPQNGMSFRHDISMDIEKAPIKTVSKYELKPGMMANEDQIKAIDKIDDFLKSDQEYFLLEGGAGVGKTSSINKAIEGFKGRIIGSAISAEATSNLQLSMIGKETMTVAKLIGLVAEKRGTEIIFRQRNAYEEKKFRALKRRDPIEGARLVIVDEASMIDKKTLKMLETLKPKNTKIIYLGDRTQLPPIGEVVSDVFTKLEDTNNYAKLDKPMRFGEGDPIFKITNDLFAKNANNHFLGKEVTYNPLDEINKDDIVSDKEVVLFRKKSAAILNSIIESFKKARANNDLKEVVVIADTNAKVSDLNVSIRKELYGENAPTYVKGELIVFKEPLVSGNETIVPNNTKAIINSISEKTVSGVNSYVLGVTLFTIDTNGNTNTHREVVLVPKDKNEFRDILNRRADQAKLTGTWPAFYKFKESFAGIDYAYAMTVHKVQGSTYKTVYVDVDNVYRQGNPRTALEINQMMRTATSRPTTNLILMSNQYDKSSAEEIKNTDVTPVSAEVDLFNQPETSKEAKEITTEGLRKEIATPTTENPLPLIDGFTIDPVVKSKIDTAIQNMKSYQDSGYKLAFPATGLAQYMIGADDLTGELKGDSKPIARATFVYLSQQLFENFGYVNPNFEKALYDQNSINVVKKDSPVTDDEVRDALSFCFK